MQELLRQVTRAKEVELSVARDAIAAVKSEQESQAESLQQALRAETEQLRYLPDEPLALPQRICAQTFLANADPLSVLFSLSLCLSLCLSVSLSVSLSLSLRVCLRSLRCVCVAM
jgi:hypothetical protein